MNILMCNYNHIRRDIGLISFVVFIFTALSFFMVYHFWMNNCSACLILKTGLKVKHTSAILHTTLFISLEFSVPSAYLFPKYVSFHLYTNHTEILVTEF